MGKGKTKLRSVHVACVVVSDNIMKTGTRVMCWLSIGQASKTTLTEEQQKMHNLQNQCTVLCCICYTNELQRSPLCETRLVIWKLHALHMWLKQTCLNSNISKLHLEGSQSESCPGHHQPQGPSWFSSFFPGKFQDSRHNLTFYTFQIHYLLSSNCFMLCSLVTDSIIKQTTIK